MGFFFNRFYSDLSDGNKKKKIRNIDPKTKLHAILNFSAGSLTDHFGNHLRLDHLSTGSRLFEAELTQQCFRTLSQYLQPSTSEGFTNRWQIHHYVFQFRGLLNLTVFAAFLSDGKLFMTAILQNFLPLWSNQF